MKDKMLHQMKRVTEAQYMQEHARVKPILDAEASARAKLAQLDQQVKDAREQSDGDVANGDLAMRSLGADLLWEGWHTRMRRQLNTELAQATAQKLMAMDRLRKSFGRKHAVETMAEDAAKQKKADQAARLYAQLMNQ
ncbi:hypothetical protein GFB49_07700 [Epibacterium sp. SM1979]|uniref:Flagellar FliJ protein n=1 Tax=Tritonibacter litoralis TaxID=2662264 RepID=A0A843YAI7_9RHOB|nr:hypothetical protein [Tritonibacter litoralis]MQQ08330.1 hypothetical protein [Tritonibacter litoralis]